jgi:hypothetical protein
MFTLKYAITSLKTYAWTPNDENTKRCIRWQHDDMTMFSIAMVRSFWLWTTKEYRYRKHAEWRCLHEVIHSHETFEQKGSVRDKSQKKGTIKFHESIQLPEQNKGY